VTRADLVDELRTTGEIIQRTHGLFTQGGTLQCADVGYAAFDGGVAESDVACERGAAQVGGGTPRHEVVKCLCLKA